MKIKRFLRWLFCDALHPAVSTRRWTVSYGGLSSGRCSNFWSKKKAIEFAESRKEMFVSISDDITSEMLIVKPKPNPYE